MSGRDDRLVYVIPKEIVSGDIGVTVYFGKGMVSKMNVKESILNGKAALGIEFGSTRIKAGADRRELRGAGSWFLSLGESACGRYLDLQSGDDTYRSAGVL